MTSGMTLPDPAEVARDRGIKLPCAEHDPALWYPEGTPSEAWETARVARALCMTCPLRKMCRDYALGTHEPYGIWGGLTETNRHTIHQGRRPRDHTVRWLAGLLDVDAPDEDDDADDVEQPDAGELAPVEDIPTHLIPAARAMEILGLNSQQALSRLLRRYDVQPAERARRGGAAHASHLYDIGDVLRVKARKKTYRRQAIA
jgi:WhiB family transcriptional regulator, redox-sensing transcriptional regulator